MVGDDQKPTTAFLARGKTYGCDEPVEVRETHISRLFLVGSRVFKMKRAVKLPYVDFSTPELRLQACFREVALNSRTTPDLYLGVRKIFRHSDGRLSFDPGGEVVDTVIEMNRFDENNLLDHWAADGRLSPSLIARVTSMIVGFHAEAEIAVAGSGAANIAGVLDINQQGFRTSQVFTQDEQTLIDQRFRRRLERHAALLNERAAAGFIRLCHGDLHLRNIFMAGEDPKLFDCIEFNDQIATVDVLYDLAFLIMDLWHRGLTVEASMVANRYMDATGEDAGFALLSFFVALRAAVRAHVTATQADEAGGDAELEREARTYFDLALTCLDEKAPRLIAIGGFSGSGKSTVADRLTPRIGSPPGARLLESDRVRKALHGVAPEVRLPPKAYAPEVSDRVYREIARRSAALLKAGVSVVADAVYDGPARREEIRAAAAEAGSGFEGIWLDVPIDILHARISARRGGTSDATGDVLTAQLAKDVGTITWQKIDASRDPETVVQTIQDLQPD